MLHHDPSGPSAPFRRSPPFWLGPYLVVDGLGRGGMGEVFLARHTSSVGDVEKLCVLKAIRHDIADEEYIQRFFDEARVLFRLAHRNICPVFEVGEIEGGLFISMAYVPGLDLAELIEQLTEKGRALPPGLAVGLVCEILEALDYAHRLEDPASGFALGIVHRDVSPQNVMFSWEGEVRLIDFGLAKSRLNKEKTQQHVVFGKARYMAPEHAQGLALDGRADQYAAAILLYELLANERFYEGVFPAELPALVASGRHRPRGWADLDPALLPVLERALAGPPDGRFPDCGAFLDELLAVMTARGWRAGPRDFRKLFDEAFADHRDTHREKLKRYLSYAPERPAAPEATRVNIALSSLGPSSAIGTRSGSEHPAADDDDDSEEPATLPAHSLPTQTATALGAPEPATEEASAEDAPIFQASTQEPLPPEFGSDPTLVAPRPVSMDVRPESQEATGLRLEPSTTAEGDLSTDDGPAVSDEASDITLLQPDDQTMPVRRAEPAAPVPATPRRPRWLPLVAALALIASAGLTALLMWRAKAPMPGPKDALPQVTVAAPPRGSTRGAPPSSTAVPPPLEAASPGPSPDDEVREEASGAGAGGQPVPGAPDASDDVEKSETPDADRGRQKRVRERRLRRRAARSKVPPLTPGASLNEQTSWIKAHCTWNKVCLRTAQDALKRVIEEGNEVSTRRALERCVQKCGG